MIQAGRQERVCFYNGIYFIRDSEIIGWLTFSYLILLLNHCCYYPQTVFIYFPTMPIRMNFLSIRRRQIDKNFGGRGGRAASDQEPNHFVNTWCAVFVFWSNVDVVRKKKLHRNRRTGRPNDRRASIS